MGIALEPYQWLVTEAMWKPVTMMFYDQSIISYVSGVMHVTRTGQHERVRDVRVTYSVPSSSGTLQIEVLTPGQNAGAGVDQLTGTIDLATTADTPISGTLIDTLTQLNPGDMLGFVLAGTLTGLVNCLVEVYLEQLQKL